MSVSMWHELEDVANGDADVAARRDGVKEHTPGPWRWGDWGATFGTEENPRSMRTLERNLTVGGSPAPYRCGRQDGRYLVLQVADPVENEADRELIRRAPELAAALHEMLDMFEGNMDSEDANRFRDLAGVKLTETAGL